MYKIYLRLIFLLIFFLGSGCVFAQTSFFQEDGLSFDEDFLNGFSEDGRIKVLLLTLAPSGMTETAAEQIGKAIELNLYNTNHFTIVGPSEWNAQLQARDPNLADCHDIACGILIGKLFNADKVLVGSIKAQKILNSQAQEVEGFHLSVRLLDVLTNTTDFSDEIQFTDDTIHDELFVMSVRMSENTLLRGRILNTKEKSITIDWGRVHGIKEGDKLVVYKQPTTTVDLEGKTLGLEQRNIAIAQIYFLNDMTSEAVIIQRIEPPQAGYYVKTYVNHHKQVTLTSHARRELDIQKKLTPRKRLVLSAEAISEDTGEDKWRHRLELAKYEKNRWMYLFGGSVLGAVIMIQGNIKPSFLGDLGSLIPYGVAGFAAYSGYQFFQKRNLVREIRAEGRVRNFMANSSFNIMVDPQRRRVAFQYRF